MATTDLLTAAEARVAVGKAATDTTQGTLLAQMNSAVSRKLVSHCGPVVQGTFTETLDGKPNVYLTNYPVVQLSQVVDNGGTLTASDYRIDLVGGKLTRFTDGCPSHFTQGANTIVVAGTAGRCADTASVPDDFKIGASLMLKNVWRAFEQSTIQMGEYDVPRQSFPSFSVPKAVKELLGHEWHTGSGVGD